MSHGYRVASISATSSSVLRDSLEAPRDFLEAVRRSPEALRDFSEETSEVWAKQKFRRAELLERQKALADRLSQQRTRERDEVRPSCLHPKSTNLDPTPCTISLIFHTCNL